MQAKRTAVTKTARNLRARPSYRRAKRFANAIKTSLRRHGEPFTQAEHSRLIRQCVRNFCG